MGPTLRGKEEWKKKDKHPRIKIEFIILNVGKLERSLFLRFLFTSFFKFFFMSSVFVVYLVWGAYKCTSNEHETPIRKSQASKQMRCRSVSRTRCVWSVERRCPLILVVTECCPGEVWRQDAPTPVSHTQKNVLAASALTFFTPLRCKFFVHS